MTMEMSWKIYILLNISAFKLLLELVEYTFCLLK